MQIISWQFVVLGDDGQDTRLFVVKTLSNRLKNEAASAGVKSAINRLSVDYRRELKTYLAIICLATRRGSDGKPGHRAFISC